MTCLTARLASQLFHSYSKAAKAALHRAAAKGDVEVYPLRHRWGEAARSSVRGNTLHPGAENRYGHKKKKKRELEDIGRPLILTFIFCMLVPGQRLILKPESEATHIFRNKQPLYFSKLGVGNPIMVHLLTAC